MPSLPIRWILARTHCQATEDEDRVARALGTAASGGTDSRDVVEGQFGNPVVVLVRKLERSEEIRAAWDRWRASGLLGSLAETLDSRIDEDGVLHFRVSKNEAFEGRIQAADNTDSIDIQVKLKAYPANPQEIRKVAHALFEEAS